MRSMFTNIYRLPLFVVFTITMVSVLLWTIWSEYFSNHGKQRQWVKMNRMFAVIAIYTILRLTVFSRGRHAEVMLNLIPLHTLVLAKQQRELYRTMIMNAFLFVPYGLFLPFSIPGKTKTRVILTIMSACMFSVAIETLQYIFALGVCEIDDVIMNTLGAATGTLAFIIYQHRK